MNNEGANLTLNVIASLATWLENNGFPSDQLPQALIAPRPSQLWQAVSRTFCVTFMLGEHNWPEPAPARHWIHRRDAEVNARFVEKLSGPLPRGARAPKIQTRYVPFHRRMDGPAVEPDQFEKDQESAKKILARARRQQRHTLILIGSQLVNYSVEHLVAWLCQCAPFTPPDGARAEAVKFYMLYRETQVDVPSCFGGRVHPGGDQSTAKPGIYYFENRTWKLIPCTGNQKQDAGVVITVFDRGTGSVKIVVFGHSGRSTEAMGQLLVQRPEDFWKSDETPRQASGRGGSKGRRTRKKQIDPQVEDSAASRDGNRTARVHLYRMKFSDSVVKDPDQPPVPSEIKQVKMFEL